MEQQVPNIDAFDPESATDACYIILTIDQLQLLVSQTQIYTLEPVIDLIRKDANTEEHVSASAEGHNADYLYNNAIGQIAVEGVRWPVYCLTSELEISHAIPIIRRVCVLFNVKSEVFGLLCDKVVLLEWSDKLTIQPLPECMCTPNTRLRGLVLRGDSVLCMALAEDLLAYCVIEESQREVA